MVGFEKALRAVKVIKDQIQYRSQSLLNLARGYFIIYHSYYNEKLRVDKLASFTLAYKSLAVFVCQFLRTSQTKCFDINFEYIKRFYEFWGEIYSENCQLFESYYRF